MLNIGRYRAFGANAPRYSARAMKIVERTLVIDMLAPLKIDFKPEAYAGPISEQAAADFRASGITGFHNSIGTGGPTAVEETLAFIAAWQGYAGRNSHVFSLVGTAADLDRAKKERKIAVIMGVQNAEHFREPGDVKKFYQLGQRCAQLTYNSQNLIGSGSTDRVDGGVSDFGEEIIKAMNEVGMLVDVSHCGDRTTLDAIELSPKPIAITHSNCRALNNHPRLKTDEAIQQARREGRRDGHHRRAHVRERQGADDDRAHRRSHRPRGEAGRHRARRHRLGLRPVRLRRHAAGPVQAAEGVVQGELRLPRQDRHRRLRPSAQDVRPDRGADPPRLFRRQHRRDSRRQFPPAARRHLDLRPGARRVELPQPYLLFLGDVTEPTYAKTAFGLRDWARERCVGEWSCSDRTVTLGLPRLSPAQAHASGARSMVIGVANIGGKIVDSWLPHLLGALEAGLDVVSGMHARLADTPALKAAAQRHRRRLIDVRTPPHNIPIANGRKRTGKRLLTVGTDCALGKKYTALTIARAMKMRGVDADFRATGQTGIMIAGAGMPMDAVVCGLRGRRRGDAEPGRCAGSLGCDRRAGVAVASFLCRCFARPAARQSARRDRGVSRARAHACHRPSGAADAELSSTRSSSISRMGRRTNPAIRCGGVSFNTSQLSDAEARRLMASESQRLGLPVADPVRGGAEFERLLDNCLRGSK